MHDTATVTGAGFKAEIMNAYIVTHTANKMLQFNWQRTDSLQLES